MHPLDPEDRNELPVRRRRALRRGLVAGLAVLALFAALAVAALSLPGRAITAPDWLMTRLEARAERNLGGLGLDFGEATLVVRHGWRPAVRLRDVELSAADGTRVALLERARISLSLRPLLRGRILAKQIDLGGLNVVLRRDAGGNLSLAFGENAAPVDQARNLPALIEDWDGVLDGQPFAALTQVSVQGVRLRLEDARVNRHWTLDDGRLQLDKDGARLRLAASFAVLSGGRVSTVEANYASRIGDLAAEFGVSFSDVDAPDIAAQSPVLGWLDVLRAPISGALRGSVDGSGSAGPVSATLQIGAGALQPTDATRPVPFSGARGYFTFDPRIGTLVFDELSVESDWITGRADGTAMLSGIEAGALSGLDGQFTFRGLRLNPDDRYDEPLDLDGMTADFRLDLNPFRLTLGEALVTTPHERLRAWGVLDANPEGWQLALDAEMGHLATDRLLVLWPQRVAPKPRRWVETNLHAGDLSDIDFALRLAQGNRPVIHADFGFSDVTARVLKTQPPVTNGTGTASLTGNRFVVSATGGQITADQGGALDIAGTSFIVPDVAVKPATPGLVRLKADGPITAVLSLLNRPPLSVIDKTPLPVDMADGRLRAEGTIAFPMKKKVPFEDLEFHFSGDLTGLRSDVLVPGHEVSARALRIEGNQDAVRIEGDGLIGELPVRVAWRQPLGKSAAGQGSTLTGTVELSARTVDTFRLGLPPGSVAGKGQATFALDLKPDTPPELALSSDLRGVRLSLGSLGWSKAADTAGRLDLSARLGDRARVDRLELEAAGLSVAGRVTTRTGGGLDRAEFDRVRLGGWLDVRAELVGQGNGPPVIRVHGGQLDLRRASFGRGSGTGASGPLDAALDRLQVTDTIALTGFTGNFVTTGGLSGPFRGRINGGAAVTGRIAPQAGRSAIHLKSDDAGGVFRDAGILRNGRGGELDLTLTPASTPGEFNGRLAVRDTRVQDAPAMAALLNSISLVGLLNELSGQGILFGNVDARFRLGPRQLTLFESSATGASIGLSMDGIYDVVNGRLNMQGVVSPIYMLNAVGAPLSRRGEGLIGFNYTLTGAAASPNVSVNPLSALAPGILRDLFRGAPPPSDGSPAPQPRRRPRTPSDDPAGGR
ncbi:AsmA-like C-terminal region-containing protein [Pukyongiella litopenaei]|uniref:Uncharacterized protein n=1 Tax=Pukyongiella litopenaei TaxID=2605946 RepID=A0A2S0MTW7_9RHOB|nr:AsmA-like C-terminal region-containing protein [Pukyongiella litopenaei]AVO39339.2 hypothetical protein C6Y53_17645 [Pukyongiella litopenaei]